MRRLLGLRDLVHDAIDEVTNLVEATHEAAARKPIDVLSRVEPVARVAQGVDGVRRGIAQTVFEGVRRTNRGVQAICDPWIALAADAIDTMRLPLDGALPPSAGSDPRATLFDDWVERAESALNGVVGDFLAARENPLAVRMSLRHEGRPLPLDGHELERELPHATGRLCIFVHGLGCSDSVWRPAASAASLAFGEALADEHGYTPLYVRYNTGLRISENGRSLARLLSELVAVYPVPIEQIALVGHSMGGLVIRSAVHEASLGGAPWLPQLSHVLGIGTPHFGAPLARAGHAISAIAGLFDTAATHVSAQVLRARSAGIKDLAYGAVLDEEWLEADPEASSFAARRSCPFVEGVAYGYVAARYRPGDGSRFGEWLGDLIVHLPSASGQHRDPARHLPFHMGHVIEGTNHVALTTHPEVYAQLVRFLSECRRPPRSPSP